jgi:hypothetical protein
MSAPFTTRYQPPKRRSSLGMERKGKPTARHPDYQTGPREAAVKADAHAPTESWWTRTDAPFAALRQSEQARMAASKFGAAQTLSYESQSLPRRTSEPKDTAPAIPDPPKPGCLRLLS